MNASAIYSILARAQARLNLILIWVKVFKSLGITAGAAGLAVLAAHLCGWSGANLLYWLLLTLVGGLAGFVCGWYQRLKPAMVARWLDEQLHSYEALTAALICLERGCNGALDKAIVDRALLLAENDPILRWPLKGFKRQALLCAAICLAVIILLGLGLQLEPMIKHNAFADLNQSKQTAPTNGRSSRDGKKLMPQTPNTIKEIARAMFPQDLKMARQFEKALIRGDQNTIKSLLKNSTINWDEKAINDAASPEKHHRPDSDKSQLMQALLGASSQRYMPDRDFANNSETGNTRQNTTGKKPGSNKEQNQGDQTANDVTSMEQARMKAKMNGYGSGNFQPQMDGNHSGKPRNGTLAGRGPGDKKSDWGEIKAKSGQKTAMITKQKDSPVLEFVLPGKNSKMPVSQILPAMRREAEAAIARRGVPGEYQDFMRYYFMELSQKLQGQAPENGGQK